MVERWLREVRFAVRRLRRRPAATALAIATLALGVGGVAAIAGIVRPLLVDPLPYPHAERLAQFWRSGGWASREVLALRDQWSGSGFATVAAYRPSDGTLERPGAPARLIPGIASSVELFQVLDVKPMVGRGFVAGEDLAGAAPVAVVAHWLWRELGADPSLVGKTLEIDGVARTVIGVMPPGFWFPDPSVGVWTPQTLSPTSSIGLYTLVGRVSPGQDVARMQPALDRATGVLAKRFTYTRRWDITKDAALVPLRDAMVGAMRPVLLATLAGMAVILLIACANVSGLVLAQVESRATEMAVRAALGADRGRIAAQIVTEMLVLGAGAGVAGSGFAVAGLRVLREVLPLGAWRERAALDWTLFLAGMAVAVAGSLGVAALPVLSLWRRDVNAALAGGRTSGILKPRRLQSYVIVGEVALGVLLACAAGLLVRSVSHLYAIKPGVETRGVAVLDVATPNGAQTSEQRAMMANVLRALATLPGVRAAAATQRLPLRGPGWTRGLHLPGAPDDLQPPNFRMVSRDYFAVLGIPTLRGRTFASTDAGGDSISSIVVNAALVRTYFPTIDPIGQIVPGGFGKPERIVGVVGNVAEATLTDPFPPAIYYLADQLGFVNGGQSIVVRCATDDQVPHVLSAARQVIARTAPAMAVQDATSMSAVLDRAVGPARDLGTLLSLLTGLAMLLAAIGVYGAISQFVARRRRDWSIRVALGLAPARVVGSIVGHGASLVMLGVLIGVAAALVSARLVASFLFGVTTHDPVAVAGGALALLVAGIAASLVPAVRAGRSDPAVVLREQ